jgi:hypothetical protein
MTDAKTSKIPLQPGYGKSESSPELLADNKDYQKLIGCLLYLSVNSRPDIADSVAILSQNFSKPNKEDWNELKRILKYRQTR